MPLTEMTATKPWYQSKTVWGSLIAVIAAILGVWDVRIAPAEQARVVELIVQLTGAFGGLVALIGRFAASRRIA